MDEEFAKSLVSNYKCMRCGQHYQPDNADVIAHNENVWIFAVYCPSCQVKSMLAAVVKETEIPEVITELTEAEQDEFCIPVCSDDVLDIHVFLRDFDGDFTSLLSE